MEYQYSKCAKKMRCRKGGKITCVNGNSFDPSLTDILSVADIIGIGKDIQEIGEKDLGCYLRIK